MTNLKKEIEEQRAMLQTYLASDMDIDKMDFHEVVNFAISDVNDQNIFLGHWKDYAFLRGKLEQQEEDFKLFEKIIDKLANKVKAIQVDIGEYDKFISVHDLKYNLSQLQSKRKEVER
jgi:hypothetical protein